MATEVDEPISVGAVFANGTIKPVWFSRRGRQVRIREVALTWKTRQGSAPLLHFSVTDGQGLYEIRFNTLTLGWRLSNAEESSSAEFRVRSAE